MAEDKRLQKHMPRRILFVDDDPLLHRLYKPHIERAGYEWIGAMDGQEGFELAVRQAPHLVIIDVMMPKVDGFSAVVELKKTEATRGIPVIVITAEPQYHFLKHEFMDAGAAAFMTKPFGPGQLLEAIGRLLQGVASA